MQHDHFSQQDCYLLLMPFVRFVSKRTSRAQMHKRLEGFSVPLRPTDSLIIQWKNIFNQCTYTATVWDVVPWYAELGRIWLVVIDGDQNQKQVSFFVLLFYAEWLRWIQWRAYMPILWVNWIWWTFQTCGWFMPHMIF